MRVSVSTTENFKMSRIQNCKKIYKKEELKLEKQKLETFNFLSKNLITKISILYNHENIIFSYNFCF